MSRCSNQAMASRRFMAKGLVHVRTADRKRFAAKAFNVSSHYDTAIFNYFNKTYEEPVLKISETKGQVLRYGENPHQKGFFFGDFEAMFTKLHGKELSYNNLLDVDAAVNLMNEFKGEAPTFAILKHNNACGIAQRSTIHQAYVDALAGDPVSAFGGIVAFTNLVDKKIANKLNEIFLEVISAPEYTNEALSILKKKKNRRLLKQIKPIGKEKFNLKSIPGGIIQQETDNFDIVEEKISFPTTKKPDEKELEDLYFAWKVAKHTKSNAIVFAKGKTTLGVGAGQMSRLDSAKIAYMKAKEHGLDLDGSVAASDAFFPFADGLIEIINCGAVSVIQPGGSVRDQDVIDAANDHNVSMVFTGIRHFKH